MTEEAEVQTPEDVTVDTTTDVQEEQSNEVVDEAKEEVVEAEQQPEREEFPKTAKNAISRRNKTIARQRVELEQLRQQIESSSSKTSANSGLQEPNIDDYDDYDKYETDKTQYLIDNAVNKLTNNQPTNDGMQKPLTQAEMARQDWTDERTELASTKLDELKSSHPDAEGLLNEYADVFATFSPELEQAVLSLDDAPMAMYNLAKSGELNNITYMHPTMAVNAIIKAGNIKSTMKVTAAPKPMAASNGSGSHVKELNDLSPSELVDKLLSM